MLSNSLRVIQISIAGISALLFFLVFYIKIFPKKTINLLALLLLVSLLPLLSILRPGTYESGDLSLQACASLSFYNALLDGQIVPRWGGELINGFGSPYHIVMYILPYYIISVIHFFGFTILNSIKLFLTLSFIGSGMAMYLFMKKDFGEKAAFAASIFYLFAPYHLVDMHFRVDIGEMAAFIFLPLTFFFINKIIEKFNFSYFAFEGLSVAFLILSHQAISLFFVPFIFMYAFIKLYKSKTLLTKKAIFCIGAILSGISFASFYYFPILFEATKYTHFGKFTSSTNIYLHNISEYLVSPWRWGFLFQGPSGELSFIIGYTQLAMVIFAVFLLVKKRIIKSDKLVLIFLLLSFFITFFIMLPESNFLWNIIPLAKYTVSTYRYLLPLSFFIAVIAGIVIKNFPNRLFFITVCFITIAYTILNWGNRRTIPAIANDSYFENIIPTYILGGDGNGTDFAAPIWLDMKISPFRKKASSHLELIAGSATFKEIYRNSTKHEYVVNTITDTSFTENTSYYPGWELKVDNKVTKINYKQSKNPGIITFSLSKGLHKVELTFKNTLIRMVGDIITFFTLIVFIFMFIYELKKKRKTTFLELNILDNPKIWHIMRKVWDVLFGLYKKRMNVLLSLGVTNKMSIIDVACGTGQYSSLTDGKYLGIDLNNKYIEYANKIYGDRNKKFVVKDVNKLIYEKSFFDVALLIDATHHLTDKETENMLNTLGKIAKKKIIICDPVRKKGTNFIGKLLINFDRGKHIREEKELLNLVSQKLKVIKTIPLKANGVNTVCILAKPKK